MKIDSMKQHLAWSSTSGYTLCGRYITFTIPIQSDPAEVTCKRCLAALPKI